MNDRGLGISAMDLVKNLGLKKLADDDGKKQLFLTGWNDVFEKTLDGSHLTFLRYSVNFRSKFITKAQIYNTYKELIFNYLHKNSKII